MSSNSLTLPTPEESQRLENRARRIWVSIIVGLLGTQVLIGFCSIYLSVGDPTVAIIPHYHQSALDWDVKHRAMETRQRLGWNAQPVVAPPGADGQRQVEVRVVDASGHSVPGLHVEAELFHHARGSDIDRLIFQESEPGLYIASTHILAKGVWQFDFRIESDQGIAGQRLEMGVN